MKFRIRDATPADGAIIADFNSRMAEETEGHALDSDTIIRSVRHGHAELRRYGIDARRRSPRRKQMLEAGAQAPEFELENDQGGETTLSDLLQNGPLILYFYPADFTPGCTLEACSIRDIHNDIQSVGLQVAGVSPQDADSHRRFRDQHDLPFILLSDPDKVAIKLYDVDGPFGIGVRRATFLINQDGTIQDATLADVLIGRHKEFIEKAVLLRETGGFA